MKTHLVRIAELVFQNGETCLRLESKSSLPASAGQFLQAYTVERKELLPLTLHPCGKESDALLFNGAIPKRWLPGDELHVRGPRGNGFHFPPLARRIALTTLDQISVNRLLPLADRALNNGAEVTLLTNTTVSELAPQIEVLPLSDLNQIKAWADYLAACLPTSRVAHLHQALELPPGKAMPFPAEVMLDLPLICNETSACGVCSVFTVKGWKLGCKDGPVFSLDDLPIEVVPHG